ncbi:sulfotransferase [Candidatus Pelagibacter sp.]|nr:sulfotransferase [Candidatus Pelagibacter sp.]
MYNQSDNINKVLILIENKNYKEAKFILLEIIHKEGKNTKIDARVYYLLYLAFEGLKEIKNAKKYLEKCLKINDKNHLALNNLANIYLKEGSTYKAEKLYLKSLEHKSDYLIGIANLAIFYQNIGRHGDAKKFYLKLIKLSPKNISIYFNLSRIDKNFVDEEKLKYISNLMKSEKLDSSNMAYGFFLLAENERRKGNFIKEFECLKKAHEHAFNFRSDMNIQTLEYWKNIIPKKYDKFNFENYNKKNNLTDFKPIFIIGLPRSGSTMTEAILSSGVKDIAALGETSIFNGIIVKDFLNKKNLKIDINLLSDKILSIFYERNYNIKNKKFIDKSLENFLYIDVILKVFPQAKFINTFRNIEDNIFAIFQQYLTKLSWTHSIDNILSYIDNYLKVTDHFIKKYPDKIFLINLEDLTNNTEEVSKKLYSFCNLRWDKKALDFYKRKDLFISTASNIQIRDSIKTYDYEKYRPYKQILKSYSNQYDWFNQI